MQEKTCTKCGVSKTLDEFNNHPYGKFKKDSKCKLCHKQKCKTYNDNHKDEIKEYRAEYYQNNLDKREEYLSNNSDRIKTYEKEYRERNKDIIRHKSKIYKSINKEKHAQYNKEYKETHKKRITQQRLIYVRNRLKTDPNYLLEHRLRSRIRSALKLNTKSKPTKELLGCTIDELKLHLQVTAINNGYLDFDINNYSGKKYHIDHIIPCASFDLSDPEQQKICFHYTNMQILTSHENLVKKDKVGN